MARVARVVVPSYTYHETQRGNRRQKPSSATMIIVITSSLCLSSEETLERRSGLPDAELCPFGHGAG